MLKVQLRNYKQIIKKSVIEGVTLYENLSMRNLFIEEKNFLVHSIVN